MSPKKKSKKNAEIFADTKKSATFAPAIEKQRYSSLESKT